MKLIYAICAVVCLLISLLCIEIMAWRESMSPFLFWNMVMGVVIGFTFAGLSEIAEKEDDK